MKILLDINHPAHVHYFKYFIKIMKSKEHEFLIISRNKEIEHYLLKKYNIPFINRGRGRNTLIEKANIILDNSGRIGVNGMTRLGMN